MAIKPPKVAVVDVVPIMQTIRSFLLRNPYKRHNRFAQDMAKKDQPQPDLIPGINAKLHDNYYCSRDGRRVVKPPTIVSQGVDKLLITDKKQPATPVERTPKTPNDYYLS